MPETTNPEPARDGDVAAVGDGEVQDALSAIARAEQVVSGLCAGHRRWTMSIPARPDEDADLVIGSALHKCSVAIHALQARAEALGTDLEGAYRFAWRFGDHQKPCPVASDPNAPLDTECTCGYDQAANALMDAEEARGSSFWKNASAAETAGGTDAE